MKVNHIYQGDALEVLQSLESQQVDMCVTSPPYWGLRDYGVEGQLGLEPDFNEYIDKLCTIFDEVKRVLKDSGTCWVNLGDSYSSTRWSNSPSTTGKSGAYTDIVLDKQHDLPDKCLVGIPFRFAIEMINRGWILRNTIIWHKPNCLSGGTVLYAKTQKGVAPSTIKDLVRLDPSTVQLFDGQKWNQVKQWIKNDDPKDIKEILLRSGERIVCTGDHRFIADNKERTAKELKKGMILKHSPLPTNFKEVKHIPDELGWLIGLYLAEGSKGDNNKCLQFSSHLGEEERYKKLKEIAEDYDEPCTKHQTSENGMTINVYSKILSSIIDSYISGTNCYTKHLSRKAWLRNNSFLKAVLQGYLDGDGHWDKKNNRWRLGFTGKNKQLANDLRLICARLNYKIKLKLRNGFYFGEIRTEISNHHNCKNPYEILEIKKGKKQGHFWDIMLESEPHLFSTIGGTLVHNCMPSSAKDRFTVDFEYLFFFSKNKKYYFEQQFEPVKKVDTTRTSLNGLGNGELAGNLRFGSNGKQRNMRTVWNISTKPYKGAHFAVFPPELIETPILAGCPQYVCKECGKPRVRLTKHNKLQKEGEHKVDFEKTPYSVQKRKGWVAVRDLPKHDNLRIYLQHWRNKAGYTIQQVEDHFGNQAGHHWFEKNGSYPSIEDWKELKALFNFDDTFDDEMLTEYYKPAEKQVNDYSGVGYSDCGCNAGFQPGVVLDPFIGSGTTAAVSKRLNRNYVGIELNPEYHELIHERLDKTARIKPLSEYELKMLDD